MSVDDKGSVISESLESGALLYIVKPVNQGDLKNVIDCAVAAKKGKSIATEEMTNFEEGNSSSSNDEKDYLNGADSSSSAASVNGDNSQEKKNGKKREREGPDEEEDAAAAPKKAKVVWTNSLHNRFLQAINHIGLEKAVPKRILEFMGVPGLTRENVASHLQKYRLFLKKVAERGLWSSQLSEKAFRSSFASGYCSSLFKNAHQDYMMRAFHPGYGGNSNFSGFGSSSCFGFSLSPRFPNHNHEASSSNSVFRYGQSSLFGNNFTNFQRPLLPSSSSYPLYQPNRSNNAGTTLSFDRASTYGLTSNATNGLISGPQHNQAIRRSNPFNSDNPFKFGSSNHASGSGTVNNSYPFLNPNSNYAGIRLTSDGELIGSGPIGFSGKNLSSGSSLMNWTRNNNASSTATLNGLFGYQGASSSAAAAAAPPPAPAATAAAPPPPPATGFRNENPFSPSTFFNNNQENIILSPFASQQQTNDTGPIGNDGGNNCNDVALNFDNANSNNQQQQLQLGEGEEDDLAELLFGPTPFQQQGMVGAVNVNFSTSPYDAQLSSADVNELLNDEFSAGCTLTDKAPWTEPSSTQPQVIHGEPIHSELNGMRIDDNAFTSENQGWGEDFLDFLLGNEPYYTSDWKQIKD
ncbi:hypothetical protein JCGZ_26158 [Jatropha curcas]|uniref:HTH myb-type domain-containing protein n=1 Tax=Jatropha curcas TaxID=180498 RepID=A0A067JES4_JATCU|nr:hypothetical protein JCGZ_26158 [Jatropha curcas]